MKAEHKRISLLFILLLFAAVCFLFPVYWMFATAVRPKSEIFATGLHLWPSAFVWHNFIDAWRLYPFGDWYINSLVIAIAGTAITCLIDLMAGYAFAKLEFPRRNLLFAILLATIMVPTQVLIVPQFLIVAQLHGLDTYWSVIVPRAAEAYGVFLVRQFFIQIPDDLLQSARLDGASEWTIFWRIVLPISKPAIAVLLLLTFLARWDDFSWPLIVLKGEKSLTLPVGLSLLQGEHGTEWSALMGMSLVSILPILLLFVFLQRYFVQGTSTSGIK